MAKITLEQITEELAADGWLVLSSEYKNLDTEMIFECFEGHRVFAPWKKIRVKRECPICKKNSLVKIENEILPKPKGVKRTLALDQATKVTGYAIFDDNKLVHYGKFASNSDNEIERLAIMKNWLVSMINNWHPKGNITGNFFTIHELLKSFIRTVALLMPKPALAQGLGVRILQRIRIITTF